MKYIIFIYRHFSFNEKTLYIYNKKRMETLSEIIMYLIPGVAYFLGFLAIMNNKKESKILKNIVLSISLFHCIAFFFPITLLTVIVLIIQMLLFIGSFKVSLPNEIIYRLYLVISMALLVSNLIA